MGLFKRRDKAEPPPPWAPYFQTADRYERFESLIRAHFKSQGHKILITDGVVTIPGTEVSYGLGNLSQRCAQAEMNQWPALITDHFARIVRGDDERKKLDSEIADYDTVAPRLAVRLYEPEHVTQILDKTVHREDVPGLVTVLCIDMPDTVHTVLIEQAAAWNRSGDEVFERALSNLDTLADATLDEVDIGEGAKLYILGGDSFFNASLLLKPDRLAPALGKHGGFVSVPNRHMVLGLPFNDGSALQSIASLMHFTQQFETEGPGSISRRVWWTRNADFLEIPYELSDEKVEVSPPPEFNRIMEELTE